MTHSNRTIIKKYVDVPSLIKAQVTTESMQNPGRESVMPLLPGKFSVQPKMRTAVLNSELEQTFRAFRFSNRRFQGELFD